MAGRKAGVTERKDSGSRELKEAEVLEKETIAMTMMVETGSKEQADNEVVDEDAGSKGLASLTLSYL